jgi:hypothetical protein
MRELRIAGVCRQAGVLAVRSMTAVVALAVDGVLMVGAPPL